MSCTRNNRCENNFEQAGLELVGSAGNTGCGSHEYRCAEDRRVIKHRHIVKHRHDIVHEYDVIHQHDYHYYDVVATREEHQHHDHRTHRPEYCGEGQNCGENPTECACTE